ncbi:MAG: hypothetical protein ACRYGG_06155 [Janthinobacterium lividum]
MVRGATPYNTPKYSAVVSNNELLLRRISSIALMGGLLTTLIPFSPFSWLLPLDGVDLLDRFLAPPLLLGALFFQWQIAGNVVPVVIQLADFVVMYRQTMYWRLASAELALCVAVGVVKVEIVRRVVAMGLLGALWAVGFAATPARYKREAWEHLRYIWTFMAFNEARMMVGGRGNRRRF